MGSSAMGSQMVYAAIILLVLVIVIECFREFLENEAVGEDKENRWWLDVSRRQTSKNRTYSPA